MKTSSLFLLLLLMFGTVTLAQNGWFFRNYNESKPLKVEFKKEVNSLVLLMDANDTLSVFETGSSADNLGKFRQLQIVAQPGGNVLWQEKLQPGTLAIFDFHMADIFSRAGSLPGTRYISIKEVDLDQVGNKTYDVCTFAFLRYDEEE